MRPHWLIAAYKNGSSWYLEKAKANNNGLGTFRKMTNNDLYHLSRLATNKVSNKKQLYSANFSPSIRIISFDVHAQSIEFMWQVPKGTMMTISGKQLPYPLPYLWVSIHFDSINLKGSLNGIDTFRAPLDNVYKGSDKSEVCLGTGFFWDKDSNLFQRSVDFTKYFFNNAMSGNHTKGILDLLIACEKSDSPEPFLLAYAPKFASGRTSTCH